MTLTEKITALEKNLLDALDGVKAEAISTTHELGNVQADLDEIRSLLLLVLDHLEPAEE